MKKELKWTDLLVIAGFNRTEEDFYKSEIFKEAPGNIDFLEDVLKHCGISFHSFILAPDEIQIPPTFNEWIKSLKEVGEKNSELIFKGEQIELRALDIPMLGVVRQLNRLGLETRYSCCGHGRKMPSIMFADHPTTIKTKKILRELGYESIIIMKNRIEIRVKEIRLYDLGLELSKLKSIDDNDIQIAIQTRQEELLEELLLIPGESGNEEQVRNHTVKLLTPLVDSINIDCAGNILAEKYFGNGPKLLLSAHMDVYDKISEKSYIIKENNIWKKSEGILGADDRAGVAMIICMLQEMAKVRFSGSVKIALTVEEEIGQCGAAAIDKKYFENIDAAISLDRRNNRDIVIGSHSMMYATETFGRLFSKTSEFIHGHKNAFKPVIGGVSDLRVWSRMGIPSVNLSIGYLNEHTEDESLDIASWRSTLEYLKRMLVTLDCNFSKRNNNFCDVKYRPVIIN